MSDSDREQEEESERKKPARGDTLQDASEEAVEKMNERREGGGHAGAGDIG